MSAPTECPVKIHKVTDQSPDGAPRRCPVTGAVLPTRDEDAVIDALDVSGITANPSEQEYKRLKRVMSTITSFYESGSLAKRDQRDMVLAELVKLDSDRQMLADQIQALSSRGEFVKHPKQVRLLEQLEEEAVALQKYREPFSGKLDEFEGLYQWSLTIVEVCRWLEANLTRYCSHLSENKDNAESRKNKEKSVENKEAHGLALDRETLQKYTKGLAEVAYNLEESQDFFAASLDGRLQRYQEIERDILLKQLEVVRGYPEESERRAVQERELLLDVAAIEEHMKTDDATIARRKKMLKNHRDFVAVLKYHRDRLTEICPEAVQNITFDSKYDHYQ